MISHLAGGEMFGKRVWIAVLFVVTTMGASAVAQAEKNELGGILGRTFISDQGIKGANFFNPIVHSGNGLSFEGEYARRFLMTPVFSLSGEALLMYNHDEDLNAGMNGFAVVPIQYSQVFVAPAARLNLFPTSAVSPWISLGAGFGHFGESANLAFGDVNPGKSATSGLGSRISHWPPRENRVSTTILLAAARSGAFSWILSIRGRAAFSDCARRTRPLRTVRANAVHPRWNFQSARTRRPR